MAVVPRVFMAGGYSSILTRGHVTPVLVVLLHHTSYLVRLIPTLNLPSSSFLVCPHRIVLATSTVNASRLPRTRFVPLCKRHQHVSVLSG